MIVVFLAEGFEEVEAITPIDLMRRAGLEVCTVGIGKQTVTGSHGISITADRVDTQWNPKERVQGIVLPGGMPGTRNLASCETVQASLQTVAAAGGLLAAICAAPSVLGAMGFLSGKKATCFPGFEDQCLGAEMCETSVCRDGNVITSRGAGTALEFALEIVSYFAGAQTAQQLAKEIQCVR